MQWKQLPSYAGQVLRLPKARPSLIMAATVCFALLLATGFEASLSVQSAQPLSQLASMPMPASASTSAKKSTNGTARQKGPVCIVYDKPMRTGSSTIATALRECAAHHAWQVPPWAEEGSFHAAISGALHALRAHTPVALVSSHMWMGQSDVTQLRTRCDALVYITSCAPLHEQLWSAAKMLSTVRKTGNTSLNDAQTESALHWLRLHSTAYARLYEWYPYIAMTEPMRRQVDGRFPDLPPAFHRATVTQPLIADYVVRKGTLQADLGALLRALGCAADGAMQRRNVHASLRERDGRMGAVLDARVRAVSGVADGDTYTRLMRIALERNAAGLERIRRLQPFDAESDLPK